jgi:serine/threonine-protein kinase
VAEHNEAPTVAIRPGTPDATPAAYPAKRHAAATSSDAATWRYSTPQNAFAHAEVLRMRTFCIVGLVITISAGVAAPHMPGNAVARRILLVGMALEALGLLNRLNRTRNPDTYHSHSRVADFLDWLVPVFGVMTTVPYFGPFSPEPIILVFGIFFNGLKRSRPFALTVYVMFASAHALTAALAITHTIADPGILTANSLSTPTQVLALLLIQLVLAGTYVVSRSAQQSSLTALSELESAVRAVAQREAVLDEAREELRRAMGNGRGRFSDQLIGPFRLGEVIGRGSMGEVYQGVDTRDEQLVAVKMLGHASLGNADHVERFLRELRHAAAISSPYVVRVLAVGEEPLPHLVMERLRGHDLGELLRMQRTLAPTRVVEMLRQIGAGISAAAEAGLIHRDLKPHNVFLADDTWKILDFGVSRAVASSDSLTDGRIVGTPAYMAPEQARGAAIDHRTDLYSLAAVAYRCLTGQPLFPGRDLADLLYRVVHTAPRRPSSHIELPRDVDLVLAVALAKQPEARFAAAGELAEAVEVAFAGSLPANIRARGQKLEADGAWA